MPERVRQLFDDEYAQLVGVAGLLLGSRADGEDVRLDPAVFQLEAELPPGWHQLDGSGGYPLLEDRQARTFTTAGVQEPPAPTCDYPMNVLDALGPGDAMVSIIEDPTSGYGDPRPPPADLVPTRPAESADQICPENNGSLDFEVRFAATGFIDRGHRVRIHVALGPSATDDRIEEVKAVIASIATLGSG